MFQLVLYNLFQIFCGLCCSVLCANVLEPYKDDGLHNKIKALNRNWTKTAIFVGTKTKTEPKNISVYVSLARKYFLEFLEKSVFVSV